jgi:hypothetical protein
MKTRILTILTTRYVMTCPACTFSREGLDSGVSSVLILNLSSTNDSAISEIIHPWDAYTLPADFDYPSDYEADDWCIMPKHCLMNY